MSIVNPLTIFLLAAMMVYYLVIFIRTFIKFKPSAFLKYTQKSISEKIALIIEIFATVIAPIVGFIKNARINSGIIPFAQEFQWSIIIIITFAIVCFWLSKFFKGKLSPLLEAIIPIGLTVGIITAIVITIHFIPYNIMGFLIPLAGFEMVFAFLAIFILIRELYFNHLTFRLKYKPLQIDDNFANHKIFKTFIQQPFSSKFPLFFLFSFAVIAFLQAILILFGQAPDAIIKVFTESCGFLFSEHHNCYSGGHYLCTVAAHGNKKLVKPIRYGYRKNNFIIVNRQLLIANAFENWLEVHLPAFAKKVRRFYDSLNIPVDKWAENKTIANFLYILMKPLEWIFLGWLYATDKNPESRISKQYLPVHGHKLSINNN